jgi:hypothetical protein
VIAIVLATHNGQAYVGELIDSLRRQTLSDWTLIVGDDRSNDQTPEIVRSAARKDDRIVLVENAANRLGPTRNFARLAAAAYDAGARYVFFADQDDVWLPEKMAVLLRRMQDAEREADCAQPILVHSDLFVVDERLRPVHPSLRRFSGLQWRAVNPLRTLLVHNFVAGCGMLVNRRLFELALPIPEDAVMHDWWLALCAAAAGRIVSLDEALTLYRQHSANAVGAKSFWGSSFDRERWRQGAKHFAASIGQTEALHARIQLWRSTRTSSCDQAARLVAEYLGVYQARRLSAHRLFRLLRLRPLGGSPLRLALACVLGSTARPRRARLAER